LPACPRPALLALVLAAMASPAGAQDYPARPITLIVPYAPGGTSEAIARRVMHRLELRLGKPVIVENRPGGATVNAAAQVARAAPDGYTLLLATSTTLAINVTVYRNLTYDPVGDFVPVALLAGVPFMLVVTPSLPVETVADLVRTSKTVPGGLSYASTGYGSAAHLYVEMLKHMTGLQAVHVPYKGNAPGLNDVVAGHVQMMIGDFATSNELSRACLVRALGVSTAKRVSAAPDVPTLAEAGVAGYDASAWQMVVAPAKTPDEIIARLNAELRAILEEPEVQADFTSRGLIPIVSPPVNELKSFVTSEILRCGEVVKKAGAAGIE
jgi:tripartite-type tricarboxylate transporter receptor subunit TctC